MSEKAINDIMGGGKSNRANEWNDFTPLVEDHIENYTVPQYGDAPNDNVAGWSARDCEKQIEKYVKRFQGNARGPEESRRDLLKIAHYCCLTYNKRIQEEANVQATRSADS